MRLAIFTCLIVAGALILGPATDCPAGNKWMMEKNADELIMLNSMLLKRLGAIQQDGKIILSGDVVHEDGKVIIKLYQLQQIHSSGEDTLLTPEVFDTNLPYRIFLREETLSEIPLPAKGRNE